MRPPTEQPFRLRTSPAAGSVIKGWDLGVATMKKGEVSRVCIHPPSSHAAKRHDQPRAPRPPPEPAAPCGLSIALHPPSLTAECVTRVPLHLCVPADLQADHHRRLRVRRQWLAPYHPRRRDPGERLLPALLPPCPLALPDSHVEVCPSPLPCAHSCSAAPAARWPCLAARVSRCAHPPSTSRALPCLSRSSRWSC